MPARRPLVTAAAGLVLLLALTGCEKPSPGVTFVSDGKTARAEASQYCRGDKTLTVGTECPAGGPERTILQVRQGDSVGVDVDKVLAESGWFLYDTDAKQRSEVQDEHYFTFVADFTSRPTRGVINLEIRQVDHVPTNDQDAPAITGQWIFQLVQRA